MIENKRIFWWKSEILNRKSCFVCVPLGAAERDYISVNLWET